MRVLLQRVLHASVVVDGKTISKIGPGYLLLLGIGKSDTVEIAIKLVKKVVNLRLFPNDEGKFDKSVVDVGGAVMVVPQFTLYGNAKKGNRPSFTDAAEPQSAKDICALFATLLESEGVKCVRRGRFGADMQVTLCNDGPVTLWLDSEST